MQGHTTHTPEKLRAETLRVSDLIPGSSQYKLTIPEYQRSYEWTPGLAVTLFDDINTVVKGKDAPESYVLGSLILHEYDDDHTREKVRDVVDGQQRLTTLLMIRQELCDAEPPPIEPRQASPHKTRREAPTESPARIVRRALRSHIRATVPAQNGESGPWNPERWEEIAAKAVMVVVTTTELDQAFTIFDSQNTRGKSLDPHDLLKAYHLREMADSSESERSAVIEDWEAADQDDLAHLFSRYLYRIMRWSRGESARTFTEHDIGFFKGISLRGESTPTARYHAASQLALPTLSAWRDSAFTSRDRDDLHAQYRLDEPTLAGKPFFNMVNFFLLELEQMRTDPAVVPGVEHPQPKDALVWADVMGTREDAPLRKRSGKDTFYYVTELYMAAALYARNRFGADGAATLLPLIRRWAFSIRAHMQSLYMSRIDLMGRAGDLNFTDNIPLFQLMRNALTPAPLLGMYIPDPNPRGKPNGHQEAILDLLSADQNHAPVSTDRETA